MRKLFVFFSCLWLHNGHKTYLGKVKRSQDICKWKCMAKMVWGEELSEKSSFLLTVLSMNSIKFSDVLTVVQEVLYG